MFLAHNTANFDFDLGNCSNLKLKTQISNMLPTKATKTWDGLHNTIKNIGKHGPKKSNL